MRKALLSGDPISRVLIKHLGNQVFRRIRDRIPISWIECQWLLQHISKYFFVVITLKWRVSAEEHEEDDTKRPDITLFVVLFIKHLRSDIVRSSSDLTLLSLIVHNESESKINESNLAVSSEHDVLRLNIPMYYILRMAMFEGFK